MRNLINIVLENAEGSFNEAFRLYHGTDADFDQFDPKFYRTGKHIYTSPDVRTAAYYGNNVYLCYGRSGKMANLIEDESIKLAIAKNFADHAYDSVEYSDELSTLKQEIADDLFKNATDDEYDTYDAEMDANDDPRFKKELHRAAVAFMYDLISNGNVYNWDHGNLQAEILDFCFDLGYTSVLFTDYSSEGSSISVVFDKPADIKIVKKLSKKEIEETPYFTGY